MEIEEYFASVVALAAEMRGDSSLNAFEILEEKHSSNNAFEDSISFRTSILTEEDKVKVIGYLDSGFLSNLDDDNLRMGAFAFALEAQNHKDKESLEKAFEKYKEDHGLFRESPELWEAIRTKKNGKKDLELVSLQTITQPINSQVVCVSGGYARLDSYLSPTIINSTSQLWPDAKTYVRLDPNYFSNHKLKDLLQEAKQIQGNPNWFKSFDLHKGGKDYFQFGWSDENKPGTEEPTAMWDYIVRKIRRIEIRAERRKDDYLTLMLEEVTCPLETNGLMITRCIHLDTKDPKGTLVDEVKLNHLDLAINVYCGEDRKIRFEQSLQNGKVQNASFRTHLFRVEGVPLLSLPFYSLLFFQSQTLVNEWLEEIRI